MPDGSVLIDGMTPIEGVNQHLGLNLEEPYYYTIAGFILTQLGRIPRLGDRVEKESLLLQVQAMDGLRIASVLLARIPPSSIE
jgi:putative hemolysin